MTEQPSKKLNKTVKIWLKGGGSALIGSLAIVISNLGFIELKVGASPLAEPLPINPTSSLPQPVNSVNRTAKISIFADKPPMEAKNNFIDTNDYGSKENQTTNPATVIFTERSKDCQTIINNQEIPRINCTARPPKTQPKSPSLVPAARYQGAPLTVAKLGDGKTALLFPLSNAAPISSGFGWRLNPFTGVPQAHEGIDMVAPVGTPVLAAYPGRVEVAKNLDGYGLVVYLRHENNTQESRYAHLSGILVREGELVKQGEVIGLVGNTGLSTGPHLHFEWRYLIKNSWVAVDPKLNLEEARNHISPVIPVSQPVSSFSPVVTPNDYKRAPRGENQTKPHHKVSVAPLSIPQAISQVFDWSIPLIQARKEAKQSAALPDSWKVFACSKNNQDNTMTRLNCSVLW